MAWSFKKTPNRKVIEKAQPPLRNIIMKDRQTGFIDYKKMKGRPRFETLQMIGVPHDKRFENMDVFPKVSSKSK